MKMSRLAVVFLVIVKTVLSDYISKPASSYHNFISGRYKDNSIWSTYFPQSTEKYYKAKPSWKFPDSGENDDSSSNEIPSYRPSTVNKLPTTTITTTTSASRKSNEIIFSYDDNDPYGPDNWDKIDPVCDGNSQSPVNIYTALSIPAVRSYPLVIDGFFSLPSNVTISNSGHSAVLKFQYPNGRPVRVYGGPLEVPYFLDNIHFHWGKRDTAGSEHALNARHYSAEMHLVLYNSNYGSVTQAMNNTKGIAVLAFFYELDNTGNSFNPFVPLLSKVINFNSSFVETERVFALRELIESKRFNYLSYKGSLTTPVCYETVTWMVSTTPLKISSADLAQFRRIRNERGQQLEKNVRPLQRMNFRSVTYY